MNPFPPALRSLLAAVLSTASRSAPTAILVALLTTTLPAVAAPPGASMQELAIEWVQGHFGSPLICHIGGEPIRGMRRLQVTKGPRHARVPVARVIFVSMEVAAATRCFTDVEASVPNITGSLELRLPGSPRRDTAMRDFKAMLRRENGVEFDIAGGVLRLQEVGAEPGATRDLNFGGGKARFSSVLPGTDVERMLSAIKSPRKLELVITARDGTTIELPLFLAETQTR